MTEQNDLHVIYLLQPYIQNAIKANGEIEIYVILKKVELEEVD